MEEIRVAKSAYTKDDHSKANDEKTMSIYLQSMKDSGDSWPQYFFGDTNLFTKNPSEILESENPFFVFVYPITESCGRTDGCDSGGWRIIGRDKLIKDEETAKILGFKKILKFCGETKARGYKRTWVMEQFRLPSKWNPKQDHVVCKIQLLFQTEISYLLAKHFSYSSDPLPPTQSLPAYGVCLANPQDDGAYHLQTIFDSVGNKWPSYVTNDVFCVHPSTLVDHKDMRFLESGLCIFANQTEDCGYTDGCESGRWRIMEEDDAIYSMSHEVMGYRRVFKFCEEDEDRFFDIENGEEVLLTWIMEEYRLVEEAMKDKVLCVIKLCR
ncbi:NAC domain containing protein 23 [Raphanus sativus]|uniref:Uncharacterized protein LOC108810920 n=1 Tax=Raphanus sativus TaxID=3726 RepID=A0A6J0JS20_RAPSA|nr:uncharacterized protein LOC108810920 [Raphanus sativus]KAJ4871883.1 NAC domain containing protein 23 [Raphanus sativus]